MGAPDKQNKKLQRLEDIRTKEISMVDRAANKRRFLVVKRDEEGDMGANANKGTKTETTKQAPKVENDPDAVVPTVEPTPAEAPKPNAPEPQGGVAVAKQLEAIAKALTDLAKSEDEAGVKDKMAELGASLQSLAGVDAKAPVADPPSPPKGEEGVKEPAPAAPAPVEVEKRGAKMAKERFDLLEKAVDSLSSLIKDLRGDARSETKKSESAPASSAQDASFQAEMKSKLDGLTANVAKISDVLAGVTRVVKSQQSTLQTVAKGVGSSNALPFDGADGGPAVGEVSWPMDMNNAPQREDVEKKGTSFFES